MNKIDSKWNWKNKFGTFWFREKFKFEFLKNLKERDLINFLWKTLSYFSMNINRSFRNCHFSFQKKLWTYWINLNLNFSSCFIQKIFLPLIWKFNLIKFLRIIDSYFNKIFTVQLGWWEYNPVIFKIIRKIIWNIYWIFCKSLEK